MNLRVARHFLIIAALGAAVWALLAWPHLNQVTTGLTPDYPDLRVHDYASSEKEVLAALKAIIEQRPGWSLVSTGSGPQGSAIQARHAFLHSPLSEEIEVTVRRRGGRTQVSVRSRSTLMGWDFGQNARNARGLLAALDRQVP